MRDHNDGYVLEKAGILMLVALFLLILGAQTYKAGERHALPYKAFNQAIGRAYDEGYKDGLDERDNQASARLERDSG